MLAVRPGADTPVDERLDQLRRARDVAVDARTTSAPCAHPGARVRRRRTASPPARSRSPPTTSPPSWPAALASPSRGSPPPSGTPARPRGAAAPPCRRAGRGGGAVAEAVPRGSRRAGAPDRPVGSFRFLGRPASARPSWPAPSPRPSSGRPTAAALRHERVRRPQQRAAAGRAPPGTSVRRRGQLTEAVRRTRTRCCCSTRSRRPTRTDRHVAASVDSGRLTDAPAARRLHAHGRDHDPTWWRSGCWQRPRPAARRGGPDPLMARCGASGLSSHRHRRRRAVPRARPRRARRITGLMLAQMAAARGAGIGCTSPRPRCTGRRARPPARARRPAAAAHHRRELDRRLSRMIIARAWRRACGRRWTSRTGAWRSGGTGPAEGGGQ